MEYINSNLWMDVKNDIVTVGLSDSFLDHLKEISAINLPKIGQMVKIEEDICVIEANKTAFDIPTPVSGKIIQINNNAINDLNNADLQEIDKWIFKVKI